MERVSRKRLRYAILAASVLAVAMAAGPAFATTNLLPNGGFEGSGAGTLAGWKGVRAALTLRPDGRGGGHAVRVARTAGRPTRSSRAPTPPPRPPAACTAPAGTSAPAAPGRTMCLKLVEMTPAGHIAGQRSGCIRPIDAWRGFPAVNYTARQHGRRDLAPRRADIGTRSRATASRSTRSPSRRRRTTPAAPAAPSGFTARGSLADEGRPLMAGLHRQSRGRRLHDLPRRRVPRHGLRRPSTYTDKTVRAGKTYRYAVDAFDASGNRSARTAQVTVVMPAAGDPVIAAAGDIACDPTSGNFNGGTGTTAACRQMATSDLIEDNPAIAAVLTLGDDQYGCGGFSAFQASFDPSLGPVQGQDPPGAGQPRVPDERRQRLRAERGRVLPLLRLRGRERPGRLRVEHRRLAHDRAERRVRRRRRLRRRLARRGSSCSRISARASARSPTGTSRYYNGGGISSSKYAYFWQTLRGADADIVLNGHIHTYARFAPQDASGNVDPLTASASSSSARAARITGR